MGAHSELDKFSRTVMAFFSFYMCRWTPEKENGINLRARPRKQPQEEASENKSPTSVEEKPKENKIETRSRKWWILVPVVLLLILFAAVLYNFERLPAIKQLPSFLPRKN